VFEICGHQLNVVCAQGKKKLSEKGKRHIFIFDKKRKKLLKKRKNKIKMTIRKNSIKKKKKIFLTIFIAKL
jgi:hypothetical protein